MIPLFDCHCDTVTRVFNEGGSLRRNGFHLDLERLARYSPCTQVFAVCTEIKDDPIPKAEAELNRLIRELELNSDTVMLCRSFEDILKAEESGRIGALISVEGAEQIQDPDAAYDMGVRIIHPTWNFDNEYCGAALGNGTGLTRKGRELVKWADRRGVCLDMSHISEAGFWEVIELSEKPVIAGHSNSKAVCDNPRNLSDAQFMALVENGGGAGINLYPEFLGLNRDIEAAAIHIEHFLSLGGEKSVFLGCDLDGIEVCPEGITDVLSLEKLYGLLLRRNYPETLVRDIFRGNILNIMRNIL